MALKIIRSKKDYSAALQRFELVFQAKTGTPESDEADVLALLIKNTLDALPAPKMRKCIRAVHCWMDRVRSIRANRANAGLASDS